MTIDNRCFKTHCVNPEPKFCLRVNYFVEIKSRLKRVGNVLKL